MKIPLTDCRDQYYEGASNMVGAETGVATPFKEVVSRALLIYCYSQALQLAVASTIKVIKLMRDTLDVAVELKQFIKYSVKTEIVSNSLREETASENSGYRTLYSDGHLYKVLIGLSFKRCWMKFKREE